MSVRFKLVHYIEKSSIKKEPHTKVQLKTQQVLKKEPLPWKFKKITTI